MIAAVKIMGIQEDDLGAAPIPHTLATGKSVIIFNLKINSKTSALKTGNDFEYAGEIYQVMNTYREQAETDYLKLNSVKKNRPA
jgi:hypothetical protein